MFRQMAKKDVKELADIFTITLTAKTAFNPKGGGRLILVSAKALKVSTHRWLYR
jgi:hypothetical protein